MTADYEKSESTVGTLVCRSQESFFGRTDWISFGATSLAVLLIYLFTLAPDITFRNSGIFVTGAMYPGVPHPPGYPLWTWWGWIFVHGLPLGSAAWRASFAAATAGALACGVIALMVSRGGAEILKEVPHGLKTNGQQWLRGICGYAAGAVFGLNGAFWPKAIAQDPWSLSILLLCIVLCLLMRWVYEPEVKKFLYAAAFVYGLLLTNSQIHLAFMPAIPFLVAIGNQKLGRDLFLSGLILFIIWMIGSRFEIFPSIRIYGPGFLFAFVTLGGLTGLVGLGLAIKTRQAFSELKIVTLCTICFLVGLALYLDLPIVSMTNPPMNWAYPRTEEGFFHAITRGQYERMHPTDSFSHFFQQMLICLLATGKDFGWIYLPIAAIPFVCCWRLPVLTRNWLLASAAAFIFLTTLISIVMGPSWGTKGDLDSPISPFDARSFLSPAYVVLSLWLGCGLILLGILLTKPPRLRHPPGT